MEHYILHMEHYTLHMEHYGLLQNKHLLHAIYQHMDTEICLHSKCNNNSEILRVDL